MELKLLVTGANGFVGSWLVKRLLSDGHEVRILCRESSDLRLLEGCDFEKFYGDVLDFESICSALKGCQSVFHLAGLVGYSKAERPIMEKVNVEGTRIVLEALKKEPVQRLVHMSSVVAIGASFRKDRILNENSPYNLEKLNLGYFETKKAAEELVRQAVAQDHLDAVIVNPSTIYGPGDATKGSRKVQVKVARGKFPFYTSGGVSIIDIEDVVDGICEAWKKGKSGERYILSGENISIKTLFDWIAEVAGSRAPYIYLPNPLVHLIGKWGDLMESQGKKGPLNSENAWTSILFHWFDNQKAKTELGLKPKPAKEAVRRSVLWMKENGLLEQ